MKTSIFLPRPIDEVFPVFADARKLASDVRRIFDYRTQVLQSLFT